MVNLDLADSRMENLMEIAIGRDSDDEDGSDNSSSAFNSAMELLWDLDGSEEEEEVTFGNGTPTHSKQSLFKSKLPHRKSVFDMSSSPRKSFLERHRAHEQ